MDGLWSDPQSSTTTVAEYVPHFQASRQGRGGGPIKAKTLQLSESQLARYILPTLGSHKLFSLSVADVNNWHAALPDRPSLRRQVYSLLKALMNLAVREGLVRGGKNPCQIVGAGQNRYDKRPYMSLAHVDQMIDELPPVIAEVATLAFNAHLRLGEVLALKRRDVDLPASQLVVRSAVTEVHNEQIESTTKSSRVRVIDIDSDTRDCLVGYLSLHPRSPNERLFIRDDDSDLRHFHVQSAWRAARERAGLRQYRFHDLRHAGLTMLAEAGVPLSGLMHRAGHSTVVAAMNYQSRADERGPIEAKLFAEAKRAARA